jgi:5-methylcytosine-specific restriction protein A
MPLAPKIFQSPWKHKTKPKPSPETKERHKLYDRQWRKQRVYFLQRHPLCVMCQSEGRVNQATVVDHIEPHKGDERLFWDINNWQSLCKRHHDSDKRKMEHRGRVGKKSNE